MRTVVLVVFWLEAINVCIKLLIISTLDYPRIVTRTRGADAIAAFLAILAAGACGYLLWGARQAGVTG